MVFWKCCYQLLFLWAAFLCIFLFILAPLLFKNKPEYFGGIINCICVFHSAWSPILWYESCRKRRKALFLLRNLANCKIYAWSLQYIFSKPTVSWTALCLRKFRDDRSNLPVQSPISVSWLVSSGEGIKHIFPLLGPLSFSFSLTMVFPQETHISAPSSSDVVGSTPSSPKPGWVGNGAAVIQLWLCIIT